MPKFYCDYCDIYLTHSSTNGRKQHNLGRKHINNKLDYYKNVIKTPGFIAPLLFDNEFNVIGHLGNVKQFIQNNMHQNYDKYSNNEKKTSNHNEKDKEINKNKKQYNNSNINSTYNIHERNQNNKNNSLGTNAPNTNYKSDNPYNNSINRGTRYVRKGGTQYYNSRY